ncbi:glycosyltransferase [Thomasclavelia sp.]|uniref:glycosyltransferase family 8 protein n=1 Tax=Thomasclavelia sp. TaxID=3025757 RepID=UPI0025F45BB5|nr:glycosyltransferase [Thomasclavelia sp.]
MNIAYQSSNEFAVHTGISLYSLLQNNKDMPNLNIFLLSNGISEEELKKFKKLVKSFNRSINIIDIKKKFEEVKKKYKLMDFSNINACSEMLPNDIFPNNIDEILLIDSDTIIDGSIKDIRPHDFDKYIVSAVPNYQFNYTYNILDEDSKYIIDKNGFYFNSGVVLYNLKQWRNIDCDKLILNAINQVNDRNYFASQTILNRAIPKEYIHLMSYKYNYFGFLYSKYMRNEIHKLYNENNIREIEKKPTVLHYKGNLTRPWYKELDSEEINIYRSYKRQTEWADYPLESIFKTQVYKDMSKLSKLKYFILIKCQNNSMFNYMLYLKSKNKKM